MGYDFSFAEPELQPASTVGGFGLNAWQMQQVRMVMLEAGAVAGDGFGQVLGDPRFAPAADTVPIARFSSNGDWHISAVQSVSIAGRLRAALAADLIGDMSMFYEDLPPELAGWVGEFATFNERAVSRGGYRVR